MQGSTSQDTQVQAAGAACCSRPCLCFCLRVAPGTRRALFTTAASCLRIRLLVSVLLPAGFPLPELRG